MLLILVQQIRWHGEISARGTIICPPLIDALVVPMVLDLHYLLKFVILVYYLLQEITVNVFNRHLEIIVIHLVVSH